MEVCQQTSAAFACGVDACAPDLDAAYTAGDWEKYQRELVDMADSGLHFLLNFTKQTKQLKEA